MAMRGTKKLQDMLALVLGVLMLVIGSASLASAQSSSPNYRVEESFFGTGGELDASSPNYRAKQSAGELTVGNTASDNYQAQAGFNTTDVPFLEFTVSGGTLDLDLLNTATTATGTVTFTVRNYLSHGYVVTIAGPPPTSEGGAQIDPLSTPSASSPGTEQFGLNLRDNSSPNIGANPVQDPDNTFSFGQVAGDYNTPNLFKYALGDTVAFSTTSSGRTQFTVSYIVNIGALTESGRYDTDQVFVATATF